jgi:DNA-binding response OmpR family regulator
MKKILIIDDDPDILDALDLTFSSSGFDTQASTEGEDVPTLVHTFKPDAIILDIMLSGIDGRNIARQLKSKDSTKQIPIVMISAHNHSAQSSFDAGADAFLAKPFDIDEIVKKVEELTNHAG